MELSANFMRLFSWIKGKTSSTNVGVPAYKVEARRAALASAQRALAQRMEEVMRQAEKQLLSMVDRIRRFDGSAVEERELEMEQMILGRLVERCTIVQTPTTELLREWRDWLRAVRQEVVTDVERAELVRSELWVRGVIMDERVENGAGSTEAKTNVLNKQQEMEDAFGEWDQYLGERLPQSAVFWQKRVEELGERGETHEMMQRAVKRMREAHGHAKIWKKMQEGMG